MSHLSGEQPSRSECRMLIPPYFLLQVLRRGAFSEWKASGMRSCYQSQIAVRPPRISAPGAHTPGSPLIAQVVATVHPGYDRVNLSTNFNTRIPRIGSVTQSITSRSRWRLYKNIHDITADEQASRSRYPTLAPPYYQSTTGYHEDPIRN